MKKRLFFFFARQSKNEQAKIKDGHIIKVNILISICLLYQLNQLILLKTKNSEVNPNISNSQAYENDKVHVLRISQNIIYFHTIKLMQRKNFKTNSPFFFNLMVMERWLKKDTDPQFSSIIRNTSVMFIRKKISG